MGRRQTIESITRDEAAAAAAHVGAEKDKMEIASLPPMECCGRCFAFSLDSKTYMTGFCRRHPPQRTHFNDSASCTGFPIVHAETDWCSQFKSKL